MPQDKDDHRGIVTKDSLYTSTTSVSSYQIS
jgi:hypothetical protein